jgi:hypothetical protein
MDTSFNTLETDLAYYNTRVNILDTSFNVLDASFNGLDTHINILDTSFNTLNSSFNGLNAHINILDTSFNTLNSSFNGLNAHMNILDTSFNSCNSHINILDTSFNVLDTSFNGLNSRVNILDISYNSLNTKITTDETNITTLNSKLKGFTTSPCNIIGLSSDSFTYDTTTIDNNIYQQYGKYYNMLDSFVFMKNTPTYTNKNIYLDAIGGSNEVLIGQIYLLKNQYIGEIDIYLTLGFNKLFSNYSVLSSTGNYVNADMTLNSITLNFYLDNVIVNTKTVTVNINKTFQVPYTKSFYAGYVYQESSVFLTNLYHINCFNNMFMDTDKLLQIKGTMNVTMNSSFSSNNDITAINSSYFSFNSSNVNNEQSHFNFFVGSYRTNQLTSGAFYLNQLNSNRVYTENIEVDNVIISKSLSFNNSTSFFKQYDSSFNCNLTGNGSVKILSLINLNNGYYKCAVINDGVINDINTSVWFEMCLDSNNAVIYNILNTGFSWSITNNSNSKSISISCQYNSNYTNFIFYYFKIF